MSTSTIACLCVLACLQYPCLHAPPQVYDWRSHHTRNRELVEAKAREVSSMGQGLLSVCAVGTV